MRSSKWSAIPRYEGNLHVADPQKKSTGQFGSAADNTTTDPSQTIEGQQESADRGAKTAENIRYGQTISETGGQGGMTTGNDGTAEQTGYGAVEDRSGDAGGDAEAGREAQGYGGKEDMDRGIGA